MSALSTTGDEVDLKSHINFAISLNPCRLSKNRTQWKKTIYIGDTNNLGICFSHVSTFTSGSKSLLILPNRKYSELVLLFIFVLYNLELKQRGMIHIADSNSLGIE